jgi:hypothetical protein
MIRLILGVVLGFAVWSALWLGGNHLFFPDTAKQVQDGMTITDETLLAKVLALSIGCSFFAGLTTAVVARPRKAAAVIVLSLALVAVGVAFQTQHWSQMPVWYHLTFLGLLAPVCLLASLIVKRAARPD